MADDVKLVIAAQDNTALAFAAVERKLDNFSKKTAESSNKLAGIANYLGQNSTLFQGLGKGAELATVGVSSLSGAMGLFGGVGGILAATVLGIGAYVLGSKDAVANTEDWTLKLAQLNDETEKVQLIKLRTEFEETSSKIRQMGEQLQDVGYGAPQKALERQIESAREYNQQLAERIRAQEMLVAAGVGPEAPANDAAAQRREQQDAARAESEVARARATAEQKYQALQVGLYTEEQAIQASYTNRMITIATAEQQGVIDSTQAASDRAAALATYEQQITAQHEAEQKKRKQLEDTINQQRVTALSGFFGNLSTMMQSESKDQFETGKQAAKAQVLVDTYTGAQAVFKDTPGPIWARSAAAFAAVTAGIMRFQAIEGITFGGGSSGATVSSSGVSTSTDFNGGATPQAPAVAGSQDTLSATQVQVIIQGNIYSTDDFETAVAEAVRAATDRDVEVISPTSTLAAKIVSANS